MDGKLKLIIKIAAIALTAPATIEVAGSIYPDNLIYRLMVQAAALVLVEGALMLGWHKLDTEKAATTGQRWLYAGIAVVAYIVLWAVAISHHEGGAAWFRATLGVLLVYSIAESGILASVKQATTIDRDISKAGRVKRTRRKLAIKDAQAEIALEYQLRNDDRTARAALSKLERDQLQKQREQAAKLEHERAMGALRAEARQNSEPPSEQRSDKPTPKRGTFPHPVGPINERRKASKAQRRDQLGIYILENPELSASALVEWTRSEFGVAESTAWDDYKALKPELISTNGNGHK